MFGKTKDILVSDGDVDGIDIDGFFGDEAAAATALQLEMLRDRVEQVEGRINSQFTSMAAYAQIAQEQIELARSESSAATERTESRLTQLIERERNDRLASPTSTGGSGVSNDVEARLDRLEEIVETIQVGVQDCLLRQKALADAITGLFEPSLTRHSDPPAPPALVPDGPIDALSIDT